MHIAQDEEAIPTEKFIRKTRVANPDPYSESGSGSRRAKMTHKSRKNLEISCYDVLDVLF
jgi:hypothetical protein